MKWRKKAAKKPHEYALRRGSSAKGRGRRKRQKGARGRKRGSFTELRKGGEGPVEREVPEGDFKKRGRP